MYVAGWPGEGVQNITNKFYVVWYPIVWQAEKGTSAILDNLPHLSKEDFHVVMIGK